MGQQLDAGIYRIEMRCRRAGDFSEFETGRLVILDVRGFPVMRNWFVVHLQKKWLPPVAVAFRKFLLTEGESAVAGILPVAGARRMKKPPRGTKKPRKA